MHMCYSMFKLAAIVVSQVSGSTLQCSGSKRRFVIHLYVTCEYKYSVTIFYQFLLIVGNSPYNLSHFYLFVTHTLVNPA